MAQKEKMKEKFRIVFFGTPEFALPSLKKLIAEGFKVAGAVTKPDRAQGREMKVIASPVKIFAQENKIPVLQPEKINDPDFINQLKGLKPDLFVVVAYGKILPKEIIYLPTFDSLNLHASLLPKYRGASPLQAAILNGDEETGVTIIKMDENMDTGPILAQEKIKIEKNIRLPELHDALAVLGAGLLAKTLVSYFAHDLKLIKQNDLKATYTKIIQKEDGHLNGQEKALNIERKIRAFNPWPGTFGFIDDQKLKIIEAELTGQESRLAPGTLFFDRGKIYLATQDQLLLIKKLQQEGGKVLESGPFIAGHKEMDKKILT